MANRDRNGVKKCVQHTHRLAHRLLGPSEANNGYGRSMVLMILKNLTLFFRGNKNSSEIVVTFRTKKKRLEDES